MFVGAKIDVFGKSTELKQSDLKTTEWNRFYASFLTEMKSTFLEELRKYERKQMDTRITRQPTGRHAASANLRELINQVVCLKQRMAGFRPLLSDDIVVAFESLLWWKLKDKKTWARAPHNYRTEPFIEKCSLLPNLFKKEISFSRMQVLPFSILIGFCFECKLDWIAFWRYVIKISK